MIQYGYRLLKYFMWHTLSKLAELIGDPKSVELIAIYMIELCDLPQMLLLDIARPPLHTAVHRRLHPKSLG